jgi:hypothetical protein
VVLFRSPFTFAQILKTEFTKREILNFAYGITASGRRLSMSNDGSSFPSIVQLQFRRARAICKRDAVGQLYQDDEEIYEPARPAFDPYKAGTKSVNPVVEPVLYVTGEDDDGNQDIPPILPKLSEQKSGAQVAVSVGQRVVGQTPCGLKPGDSKPFRITARFSKNERETLVGQAEKACLTVSEFIRVSVLGPNYASSIDPLKRQQLITANRELSRQGNNLNQISKHLNAGILSPEQGESMLDILARALLAAYMAVRQALAEGREGEI